MVTNHTKAILINKPSYTHSYAVSKNANKWRNACKKDTSRENQVGINQEDGHKKVWQHQCVSPQVTRVGREK